MDLAHGLSLLLVVGTLATAYANLASAAFIRFPVKIPPWLVSAGFACGLALGLYSDVNARPIQFVDSTTAGVLAVAVVGLVLAVPLVVIVRRMRFSRGWMTASMNASRLLHPVSKIGTRITGATSGDGERAAASASAVQDWGGVLLIARENGGYVAAITKRGWMACVSGVHATIDQAAAEAVELLPPA